MNLALLWRERIAEPFEEIQEKARQQWMALNPRERMILSVLASALVVLLAVLLLKEAVVFFSRHEIQMQENLTNI